MNNNQAYATQWAPLPGSYADNQQNDEQWDPGFDAERCVVFANLGPYRKLFERPAKFTKRFYHTLYPLPVEHWELHEQVGLYDDFCIIDIELTLRFQATYNYVTKNTVELEHINTNIKAAYDDLVRNIVQTKLLNMPDARWVETGLANVEQAIALAVSELLLMHDIQAMSTCALFPTFKSFPDIKFKEDAAYLLVLKKSFEATNKKQQEQFVQEQILEHQNKNRKEFAWIICKLPMNWRC